MNYFQNQLALLDQHLARINCYKDINRVKSDVLNTLQSIPSLQPNYGIPPSRIQNESSLSMLLNLSGTLPIFFKGNQYNIPVTIWLLDVYPYMSPIFFVTPTIEMVIKEKHKHVDSIGIVYHPYISSWNAQNCNIVELCRVIATTFGEDPPVRQKLTQSTQNRPDFNYNNQTPPQTNQLKNQNEEEKKKKQLTEKIQQRLQEFYTTTIKKIDRLIKERLSIEEDKKRANQGLENATFELDSIEQQLIETFDWLEKNNNTNDDIDSQTDAPDPISRQLFDLVAEDATIEDIIYYLDKALQRSVIDLPIYLKQVRNLSTQQFLKRATIKKIHQNQTRR